MTKIISVNAGSSSLKFQLFEMPQEEVLTSGVFERIGLEEGIFTIKVNGEKKVVREPIPDHTKAVEMLLNALVEYRIVEHLDEIKGAGIARSTAERSLRSRSWSMMRSSTNSPRSTIWHRCTIRPV